MRFMKREYQIVPMGAEEKTLLDKGNIRQNTERGCIGYILGAFKKTEEFWSWTDCQKKLRTQVFRQDLETAIDILKSQGLLDSYREIKEFFYQRKRVDGEIGFKLVTEHYRYYIDCFKDRKTYQFAIFCYTKTVDGYIEQMESLPPTCYSTSPDLGDLIVIERGECGYKHAEIDKGDPLWNRELVDELNEDEDITKAQEAAMLYGCMYGWNNSMSDPENYDEEGNWILE